MIAVYLAPLYLILNVYIAYRILVWLKSVHKIFAHRVLVGVLISLYVLLTLSPLAAAFANGTLQYTAQMIFNHWLSPLLYLVMLIVLLALGKVIYRLIRKEPLNTPIDQSLHRIRGGIVFILLLAITIYGTAHAYNIKKTTYNVTIDKTCEENPLRIALVADLHLGSNVGITQIEKMTSIIQSMKPDLVVYAGDIFDNRYDAISDPDAIITTLKGISSTYGSYACWGNHDIDELILAGFTFNSKGEPASSDPRMDEFLKKSGITLLQDETVLINDSFYLVGRIDRSAKSKSNITRKTPSELLSPLDHTKPILVIDHQPAELSKLAQAGADLTLSGHTHNGQNFPGNLTIPFMWKNAYGMIKVDQMTDIVTSGVGVWGPATRVGTDSEVVEVNVHFQ